MTINHITINVGTKYMTKTGLYYPNLEDEFHYITIGFIR